MESPDGPQGRVRHDAGNSSTDWGWLARAFHWVLGAAIIGMLAYGWVDEPPAARLDRFFHRSIHADIGYLVLLLTVLRLLWRGVNPTPALPADTPAWQRVAARVSHGALYAIATPSSVAVLGWAHSGAHHARLFQLLPACSTFRRSPRLDKASAQAYENLHIYVAYFLLALVVLHLAAVAFHQFHQARPRRRAHDR